jgi:hypothetical protein
LEITGTAGSLILNSLKTGTNHYEQKSNTHPTLVLAMLDDYYL